MKKRNGKKSNTGSKLEKIDEDLTESDSVYSSEGGSASDNARKMSNNRLVEKSNEIRKSGFSGDRK